MKTKLGIAGRGYYGSGLPTGLGIAGQGYYGAGGVIPPIKPTGGGAGHQGEDRERRGLEDLRLRIMRDDEEVLMLMLSAAPVIQLH